MIQDMRSDALCGVLKTSKVASWHEMLQAKDKSNPPSGIDLTICRQLLRICQSIPQALLNPKNKDRTQVSRLFPTGATFLGDTSIWYAGRDQNCTLTKSMVNYSIPKNHGDSVFDPYITSIYKYICNTYMFMYWDVDPPSTHTHLKIWLTVKYIKIQYNNIAYKTKQHFKNKFRVYYCLHKLWTATMACSNLFCRRCF